MVTSLVAGVVSGVIASVIISVIMFGIKPKLQISDEICRDKDNQLCQIKVVNRTRAQLVDVKYFLYAGFRSDEDLTDIHEVQPVKPKLEFFQAYSRKNSDYATRISYDLSTCLPPNCNYFEFRISARHPFSGRTIVKRKRYDWKSVRCGKFQIGTIMKILPESQTCRQAGIYVDCPKKEECCSRK